MLVAAILTMAEFVHAQTWTQTLAPYEGWHSIASSASGNSVIAVGGNWTCMASTNFGTDWVPISEPQQGSLSGSWYQIASSADGTKLLATTTVGGVWVSTNSGTTWLSNNVPSVIYWGPVVMSADGSFLVAAAGGLGSPPGFIYTSTNWGTSWNPTSAPTNDWTSIASSADGTKLVAVADIDAPAYSGIMYKSTNSGASWTPVNTPGKDWSSVACSADGTKVVAVNQVEYSSVPGHIYTSTDSGATWVSNGLPTCIWESVAVSADGNTIVTGGSPVVGSAPVTNLADIFVSTNFGASWSSNILSSDFFDGYVVTVKASADGGRFYAGTLGGLVFTSQSTPVPSLNLTPSTTNLTLAWTVPSTNLVLQQSLDLSSWIDLTNPPILNLTNLQNQVTLAPFNKSGFYRLKTP